MYEWIPIWLKVTENGMIFDMNDYPYKGGRKNKYEGKFLNNIFSMRQS